jgi:hypothetical protein
LIFAISRHFRLMPPDCSIPFASRRRRHFLHAASRPLRSISFRQLPLSPKIFALFR